MIVRVSLPSWELVRELKTWKHVLGRVRVALAAWEDMCKVGRAFRRFGEREISITYKSASTCKTSRGLRRRHRSCRNLCLIWKNKAPLSWFEYSKLCKKSDGSLKKNFLFGEYSNGSDWKRFLFRWWTDDNTEEGKSSRNRDYSKHESSTCLWRRTWKEEAGEAFGASGEGHELLR